MIIILIMCDLILSFCHFIVMSFQDIVTEMGAISISADRLEVLDFTEPIFETYVAAMTTTQTKQSFFVMKPLRFSVWLIYGGMAVVVAVVVTTFENILYKTQIRFLLRTPRYFFRAMWVNFCIILNQGKEFFHNTLFHIICTSIYILIMHY